MQIYTLICTAMINTLYISLVRKSVYRLILLLTVLYKVFFYAPLSFPSFFHNLVPVVIIFGVTKSVISIFISFFSYTVINLFFLIPFG